MYNVSSNIFYCEIFTVLLRNMEDENIINAETEYWNMIDSLKISSYI